MPKVSAPGGVSMQEHPALPEQPSFPRWGIHQSGQRRLFPSLRALYDAGAGWSCMADPEQSMGALVFALRALTVYDRAIAPGQILEVTISGGPIDFFAPRAPTARTAYRHKPTGRWFVDKATRDRYRDIYQRRDDRPWRLHPIVVEGTRPLPPGVTNLTITQALEQEVLALWWPFKDLERRRQQGWAESAGAFLRAQEALPPQT
jgi:hypothetical protein